jgi:hypothetical protein
MLTKAILSGTAGARSSKLGKTAAQLMPSQMLRLKHGRSRGNCRELLNCESWSWKITRKRTVLIVKPLSHSAYNVSVDALNQASLQTQKSEP